MIEQDDKATDRDAQRVHDLREKLGAGDPRVIALEERLLRRAQLIMADATGHTARVFLATSPPPVVVSRGKAPQPDAAAAPTSRTTGPELPAPSGEAKKGVLQKLADVFRVAPHPSHDDDKKPAVFHVKRKGWWP